MVHYDIAVIGAGVVGANIAYLLSQSEGSIVLLEKENDVACGATKANSAIIHAGYDAVPGTAMARLNVLGSQRMGELAGRLSVPYEQIGSLVLAFDDEELGKIARLYERGETNGVKGLRLLPRKEVLEMEPALSEAVMGALYAPSAAIISPWELCIALCEVAVTNGVHLMRNSQVLSVLREERGYCLQTASGEVHADYVVNAAGVFADEVAGMVGKKSFQIEPVKGEYYLLDKSEGKTVSHIIFQCPNTHGKGVLTAPTVHGNLIVGPNAHGLLDKEDVSTTAAGLRYVREQAQKSVPKLQFGASIRNFAGLRAAADSGDFVLAPSSDAPGWVNVGGIQSPGLSASPAIAEEVCALLKEMGRPMRIKAGAVTRREQVRMSELSLAQKKQLIAKDARYGRVICRCETVSQGEILQALHSNVPPVSIDGVKRRCGCGMGRCQGGFCGQRVQELIAEELKIPLEDVLQDTAGTRLIFGETKEGAI